MKIFLSILIVILLATWGAAGYLWWSQSATKNAVGGYFKDKDLHTCITPDKEKLKERVLASTDGILDAISENVSDIDSLTEEQFATFIEEEAAKSFDTESTVCFTEADFASVSLNSTVNILMASLQNSRTQANFTGAKAVITSTVPSVILCIDEGGFVSEPSRGVEVCEGSSSGLGQWPDLAEFDARWGGCPVSVDREKFEFAYCATINGEVVQCSDQGCDF